MDRPKPLILTILDGWGFSPTVEGNAIAAARKPTYDKLLREFPNTLIQTSGPSVGLPEGQMGNSEVGHLNIGAGRVLLMDVMRIDLMIENGDFFRDPVLLASMRHARTHRLHLMGLASQGGVHSQLTHLYALLKMAKKEGVEDVCVHCFTDGRDTPPNSAASYLQELQKQMQSIGVGRIASVSGRYFAMDRDKRWERIEKAFGAMVLVNGHKATDPIEALRRSYEAGVTDEFVEPITVVDKRNEPVGLIRNEDAAIFYNYRADRAREMTMALTDSALERPARSLAPRNLHFTTMTQYDKTFSLPFVLPREHPNNILADVFARLSWKNLRVAETEKYAHVTYFFNGGLETPFKGEDRRLVPSQKVATYDLAPEMSAPGITDVLCSAITAKEHDFILCNYANADMVGHTGNVPAVIKAVETVDQCLARVLAAADEAGARLLITADHGNCEMMIDPATGGPHTAHTTSPVPFLVVGSDEDHTLREGGALRDVGPTILRMLGLERPAEMDGRDLRLS